MNKNDYLLDPSSISPGNVPKFDFHMHTTWTDGTASVSDMYESAVACGLEAILFSEHSRTSSGDWFPDFASEVRALPQTPCRAFVGTEVKVNEFDGTLDLAPEVHALVDLVVVSVHRFPDGQGGLREFRDVGPDEAEQIEFELSLAALTNPDTDVLGHPFGMTLQRYRRTPSDDRFRTLIKEAAANDVAFDISGRYHPDPWRLLGWCRDTGTKVILGSDAHAVSEVGLIHRILESEEGA